MKRHIALGIAATLTVAAAAPATAAKYTIKYWGTIDSGNDSTGVFGPAATSLVGQAFTAQFTLTDPTPGAHSYARANRDGIGGGTYFGTPSPVSGSYTINGKTIAIAGDFLAYAIQWDHAVNGDGNIFDQVAHQAYDKIEIGNYSYKASVSLFAYSFGNIVNSTNIIDPLNYTAPTNDCVHDCAGGEFFIYEKVFNGTFNEYSQNAAGTVVVDRITIGPAGGVPEPAGWAMLITGFGLVGAMQRRSGRRTGRRSAAAAST